MNKNITKRVNQILETLKQIVSKENALSIMCYMDWKMELRPESFFSPTGIRHFFNWMTGQKNDPDMPYYLTDMPNLNKDNARDVIRLVYGQEGVMALSGHSQHRRKAS